MQIIHDNMEIIVTVLMVVILALGISVWNLISHSEEHRENLEEFVKWFNTEFSQGVTTDMHEQKVASQELFVALWEYFYTILATRGVIKVDVNSFMKDGMDDFYLRYPNLKGTMEVIDDKRQMTIFYTMFNHYDITLGKRKKKETAEEIFDKYKPDKPIL